jgi:hypothetical protein
MILWELCQITNGMLSLRQSPSSVEDGGQVDANWLIIETDGHQRRLRNDAEPLAQAPAEQIPVT